MSTGLNILKASYGVSGNFTDVTKEVSSMVNDGTLNFQVSAQSLGILDPAPGVKKTLQVQASINKGTPTLFTKEDGEQLVINAPSPKKSTGPVTASMSFVGYLVYALMMFVVFVYVLFTMYSGYHIGYAWGGRFIGFILALLGPFYYIPLQIFLFFYSLILGREINFAAVKNTAVSIPTV